MNNGKTESNEANQKAEDLNEGIRTGSENWLILKEDATELVAVSRGSGRTRRVKK